MMTLTLVQTLYVLLILNSVIIGIASVRNGKLWPLTAFLLALTAHMSLNLLNETLLAGIDRLAIGLSFLYGPLIYLLVRELVMAPPANGKKQLWHFLPAVLAWPTPWLAPQSLMWLVVLGLTGLCIYLFASFRLVQHVRRVLEVTRSSQQQALNWLLGLLAILMLALVIEACRYWALVHEQFTAANWLFYLTLGTLVGFVSALTLMAMRHSVAFSGITPADEQVLSSASLMREIDSMQEDRLRLRQLMESQQPYREPDLAVAQLAESVAMSPRDLSALLNQSMHTNFCEFVNRYRIREACVKLRAESARKVNLLTMAQDVGFNSKSSFNQAFKKHVGMTPSQFRKDKNVQIPEFGRS